MNWSRMRKIFDKKDGLAFVVSAGVAFVVYLCSLGPSVGLEDAGELAVAADGLGVAHPPGYPLWAMISWVFCRLLGWVTWQGYPNPAWAVAFGSAVMGALATGLTALLISRSGRDLLKGTTVAPEAWCDRLAVLGGVAGSLAFAFSPVVWSQAVIVEVYALGSLFMAGVLLLTYLWLRRPCRRTLVGLGLVFGLGLTNYQVLLLAALPIGLVICVRRWRLGKSFLAIGVPVLLTLAALKWGPTLPMVALAVAGLGLMWWVCARFRRSRWFATGVSAGQCLLLAGLFSGILPGLSHPTEVLFWVPVVWCAGVVVAARWSLVQGRTVAWTLGAVALGLSVYLYLPLVSDLLNPAMNWGYPRTWEGFCRVLSREQYEAIVPVGEWTLLGRQVMDYLADLRTQFSLAVITLATVGTGALALRAKRKEARLWLGSTGLFFGVMSVVLIALANPTGDLQDAFIQKVKFISSYGIFALWIGYGLMGVALLAVRWMPQKARLVSWVALAVAVGIPLVPVCANFSDRTLLRMFGAAEQTGHDYGWQFGAYMLNGAPTLRAELSLDEEPLPDPFYPPPMEEGSVFFGGTDPGRFVPTYLVHAADFRKDIFVFTQGALADRPYMNVERDHYGETLWLPTDAEVHWAAQEYLDAVLSGRRPRTQAVQEVNGKWQIVGQRAILEICAVLAERMFERNPERTFYIEESYPMRWMAPYLEPAGLALKLNRAGGDVEGLRARDLDFWAWMTQRLVASPSYRRDVAAQKSFTQLRLAYGRVYGTRGLLEEEGQVYRDAMALYPLSFATVLRYAQWKLLKPNPGNVYDAARMVRRFRAIDPKNRPTQEFEAALTEKVAAADFLAELVTRGPDEKPTVHEYCRLAHAQVTLGDEDEAVRLWRYLARQPGLTAEEVWAGCTFLLRKGTAPNVAYGLLQRLPPEALRQQGAEDLLRCAFLCQEAKDATRAKAFLEMAVAREPHSATVWCEAMVFHFYAKSRKDALAACRKVLEYGSESMLRTRPEYLEAVQWLNDTDGGKP